MANAKAIHKLSMPERNTRVTPLWHETAHKKGPIKVNQLPSTVDKVQHQNLEYIIKLDLTKA